MPEAPRDRIGRTLAGDVLEIGPGHLPFPTAPGARRRFADRSVPGGRDATWPELAGAPHGPEADIDVNLDVDGLGPVESSSLDAVIACHVLEHLANPLRALAEVERVLRPGGRLVLVLPDRDRTFDAPRPATPFAHVRAELDAGVTEVDAAHIREFCAAIWSGPPFHPEPVRSWHDPARLDDGRLDLHRRRSIHVHCWRPEELASVLVAAVATGLLHLALDDLYVAEEQEPEPSIEFGLVLRLAELGADPVEAARAVAMRWAELVLADPRRRVARVVGFAAALARDLAGVDGGDVVVGGVTAVLVEHVERLRGELAVLRSSRALRAAAALRAPRRRRG